MIGGIETFLTQRLIILRDITDEETGFVIGQCDFIRTRYTGSLYGSPVN